MKITTCVVNYMPEDRAIIGVAALTLSEWPVEIEAIAVIDKAQAGAVHFWIFF